LDKQLSNILLDPVNKSLHNRANANKTSQVIWLSKFSLKFHN